MIARERLNQLKDKFDSAIVRATFPASASCSCGYNQLL